MTPFASVPRRTIEFETATTGSWGNWGSLGVNPSEGEGVLEKLGCRERGAEAIDQNGMEQMSVQSPTPNHS